MRCCTLDGPFCVSDFIELAFDAVADGVLFEIPVGLLVIVETVPPNLKLALLVPALRYRLVAGVVFDAYARTTDAMLANWQHSAAALASELADRRRAAGTT